MNSKDYRKVSTEDKFAMMDAIAEAFRVLHSSMGLGSDNDDDQTINFFVDQIVRHSRLNGVHLNVEVEQIFLAFYKGKRDNEHPLANEEVA